MTDTSAGLFPPTRWQDSPVTGYVVLAVVVLIWAGFALTMRAIGMSPLATADVALIRFAVPALALLPLIPGRLDAIRKADRRAVALVLAGGVPFYFIASEGARLTSAAYVGALIPGTTPLAVAAIGFLFLGRKVPRQVLWPLGLILLGVICLLGGQWRAVTSDTLVGVATLLLASLVWAAYTIGLRRTGLDAISNAILLSVGSLIVLLIAMACGILPTNLGSFSLQDALPFAIVQGVGTGLVSTMGYAFAISRLGAARSAAIGSLSPGLTSILAIPLLAEPLSPVTATAIALMTLGVIAVNRNSETEPARAGTRKP